MLLRGREDRGEGNPEAMGYCHCTSCRSWSAGPVNAFTLWQPQHVKVTKGAELSAASKRPKRAIGSSASDAAGIS